MTDSCSDWLKNARLGAPDDTGRNDHDVAVMMVLWWVDSSMRTGFDSVIFVPIGQSAQPIGGGHALAPWTRRRWLKTSIRGPSNDDQEKIASMMVCFYPTVST